MSTFFKSTRRARLFTYVAVAALVAGALPHPSFAAESLAQSGGGFSTGCSGTGPGIVSGRVPSYGPDTGGLVRIVSGDAQGDDYVAEIQQEESSKQWLLKTFGTPQSSAAWQKNPTQNPGVATYHGDPHDTNAMLAFLQKRFAMTKGALAAAGSARSSSIAKDGSFSCRGLDSGKYHLIVTMNHVPPSAMTGGQNATGMSQTTLQADFSIPRVQPGSRVLVQVTQFATVSVLKR